MWKTSFSYNFLLFALCIMKGAKMGFAGTILGNPTHTKSPRKVPKWHFRGTIVLRNTGKSLLYARNTKYREISGVKSPSRSPTTKSLQKSRGGSTRVMADALLCLVFLRFKSLGPFEMQFNRYEWTLRTLLDILKWIWTGFCEVESIWAVRAVLGFLCIWSVLSFCRKYGYCKLWSFFLLDDTWPPVFSAVFAIFTFLLT